MRLLPAAVLTGVLALTLTACGQDEPAAEREAPSATEHNDADVEFATGMIPHHAQALVMVDMAQGRDLDPEMERLLEDIRMAQTPEIETMADWLESWDEPVPATDRDHANAHGHGDGADHDMPGMMSEDDMAELDESGDDHFADMWLEMMIDHHEGAIEMAETELDDGRYQPALDLAQSIIDSQQHEIDHMEQMLDR